MIEIKEPIFKVIVKTSSRKNKILGFNSAKRTYRIELKAKPIEGEANKELIKLLSKELGKQVRIKAGFTNKEKVIVILN